MSNNKTYLVENKDNPSESYRIDAPNSYLATEEALRRLGETFGEEDDAGSILTGIGFSLPREVK